MGRDSSDTNISSSSSSGYDGNGSQLGPRVVFMLQQLGVGIDEESLHPIAVDALSNIPNDWQIMYDESNDGYFFVNKQSKEVTGNHPLLNDYVERVQRERGKAMVSII